MFMFSETCLKYNREKQHLPVKTRQRVQPNFSREDLCHPMDAQKNALCHLSSGKYKLQSEECTEKIRMTDFLKNNNMRQPWGCRQEFPWAQCSGCSGEHSWGPQSGLNEKCPPQAHPWNNWSPVRGCLRRWCTQPCWRKCAPGSRLKASRLLPTPALSLSLCFLLWKKCSCLTSYLCFQVVSLWWTLSYEELKGQMYTVSSKCFWSLCTKLNTAREGWVPPFISALGMQRQADLCVFKGQPGLQS